MQRLVHQVRRVLRRFGVAEEAVAAIEFALILPIMLLLYVGTVEAGALITMDRKVQSVAGALGDLVARSNDTITTATLTDYFRAAGGIMSPYSPNPLMQVVTQVQVRADGTAWVDWSRQFSNGTLRAGTRYRANTAFTLPAAMTAVARGQYVIVSETNYSYTPVLGLVFNQPISLFRQNFYIPRFDRRIVIQ